MIDSNWVVRGGWDQANKIQVLAVRTTHVRNFDTIAPASACRTLTRRPRAALALPIVAAAAALTAGANVGGTGIWKLRSRNWKLARRGAAAGDENRHDFCGFRW